MKRLAWFGLLMLFVGCGSNADESQRPSTTAASGLDAKAARITDLLAENNWSTIRADFDTTMTEKLSEDLLAQAWRQVTAAMGAYKSRENPVPIPKSDGFEVFDTPMHFERGDMKSRVSFNSAGKIAGLFILKPDVP